MTDEIRLDQLRRRVKSIDAALLVALREGSPSLELDDLRTEAAELRIALRRREAADAKLRALRALRKPA